MPRKVLPRLFGQKGKFTPHNLKVKPHRAAARSDGQDPAKGKTQRGGRWPRLIRREIKIKCAGGKSAQMLGKKRKGEKIGFMDGEKKTQKRKELLTSAAIEISKKNENVTPQILREGRTAM